MSADVTLADRYRAACRALGLPVWCPGMLSTHGARCMAAGLWAAKSGVIVGDENVGEEPDFNDPATVGCLLAAAREAWTAATLSTAWSLIPLRPGVDWFVTRIPADAYGATEAEALIAALEAAAARRGGAR